MKTIVTRNVAICSQCDHKIAQNGKYWEHVDIIPRHEARPKQDTISQERIEVDVEEYLNE